MTDIDARRRKLQGELDAFAEQLDDGVKPDFETRGVSLAIDWCRALPPADVPLVRAIVSSFLRGGTTEQARLAAEIGEEVQPLPASIVAAWLRSDLPARERGVLGHLLRDGVRSGEIRWQAELAAGLQLPGGETGWGAALLGDHVLALGLAAHVLTSDPGVAGMRFGNATFQWNRTELETLVQELSAPEHGVAPPVVELLQAALAWRLNKGDLSTGDGKLRWLA